MTSSPNKHYISDKGTLYIFNPNVMEDTGAYQCVSTDNENGLVYKSTIASLTITSELLLLHIKNKLLDVYQLAVCIHVI